MRRARVKQIGNSGFTLLELLVVLVLAGFLGSLVFMSVAGGILGSEERRFVQDFKYSLLRARSASLLRGEAVLFLINRDRRAFSMDGKKWREIPKAVQVEGGEIAEIEPGLFGITFYPDGSSSGAELDLRWSNGNVDSISVDRLFGQIKMVHVGS